MVDTGGFAVPSATAVSPTSSGVCAEKIDGAGSRWRADRITYRATTSRSTTRPAPMPSWRPTSTSPSTRWIATRSRACQPARANSAFSRASRRLGASASSSTDVTRTDHEQNRNQDADAEAFSLAGELASGQRPRPAGCLQAAADHGAEGLDGRRCCAGAVHAPRASSRPAPSRHDRPPQAMFEAGRPTTCRPARRRYPVSLSSGLAQRFSGATRKSRLPIRRAWAPWKLVDGEPQAPSARRAGVPVSSTRRTPATLIVNRSGRGVRPRGHGLGQRHRQERRAMMPDFMAARAHAGRLAERSCRLTGSPLSRRPQAGSDQRRCRTNYVNKFNEGLDVPGLVKIVNAMRACRNGGPAGRLRRRQFSIVVPPDLSGDLGYLRSRRDKFGGHQLGCTSTGSIGIVPT